jgi:D-hexose-6-phosphate mutarotase
MPDFYSREELLELKLLWVNHKITEQQKHIASLGAYVLSFKYHADKILEMQHCLGLELGDIYQQLEALKKL